MRSNYQVIPVSPTDKHSIHFYYDICPESPDQQHILFFTFSRPPLVDGFVSVGTGHVMIAGPDGENPRAVTKELVADSHSAVRMLWIDSSRVAYCPGEAGKLCTVTVDIETGEQREFGGALRSLCPTSPVGLTTLHDFEDLADNLDDAVCIMDFETGELRRLFTLGDALSLHPMGRDFEGVSQAGFCHTKWSPDGKHFLVNANNAVKLNRQNLPGKAISAIYVADADGNNLRYVGEEFHHCNWGADSCSIISHRKNDSGGQDLFSRSIEGGESTILQRNLKGKHTSVNRAYTEILTDATGAYGFGEKGKVGIYLYHVGHEDPEVLAVVDVPDSSQKGVHCHPVFSRSEKRVFFNAYANGIRRLFVLDLERKAL